MDLERSASDSPPSRYASSGAPANGYRHDPVRGSYSYEQRCMALAVYADTGSPRTVELRTGVPASTVRVWIETEEGQALIDSLRTAVRAKCGFIYAEIAYKAAMRTMERLEEGDEHVTKDGTIIPVAVKARDCAMIAAIFTDKHALIVGMLEGTKHVDRALGTLAEKLLAKMAEAKPKASDLKPPPASGEGYLG